MAQANAINANTTGILGNTGTAFTGSSATAHGVQVGGSTSSTFTSLSVASTGQVLQGNTGADPSFSTATYPSVGTSTGSLLRADGTNWVATTTTYPNTNAINTLLYASSANVMSALATANSKVMTTNGSGVPTWENPSSVGAWVYLGTQNAATSANVNFTTGISSTYNTYMVIYSNVSAASFGVNLWCRISTNGGSTYINSGYKSGTVNNQYNLNTTTNANGTAQFLISGGFTNTATDTASGTIYFSDFSSGALTKMSSQGCLISNTGTTYYVWASGLNTNTSQVNALRFLMSSGNILTGKFSLYGLVES